MTDSVPVIPYSSYPQALIPPSHQPRVWTVFGAFGAVLIGGTIITVIILMAAMAYMGVTGSQAAEMNFSDLLVNPRVFLPMAAGMQLTILAVITCAALLSPIPAPQRLRLGPSTASPLSIAIFAAGAVALSQFCSTTIETLGLESPTIQYISDALINLSPKLLIVAVVVIGILPGLAEELLCRGYIQTRLSQRWGRRISILITALLFGILHMDPWQSTFAFALGLYLGLIVERTGSIRPAIVCHVVNNTLVVLAASVAAERLQYHVATMLIGSAVVLIGAVAYLLIVFPARHAPPLPVAIAFTPIPAFIPPVPTPPIPSTSPPPLP
jgi:membrane protease YdiL (CAAX protease family)